MKLLNIRLDNQSEEALESIMELCDFENKSRAVKEAIKMLKIINDAYKEGYEILSIPKDTIEKLGITIAYSVRPII